MMNNAERHFAAEIAAFMRRLYRQGLTTTSGGNLSYRIGDVILMTPGGTDKGRLKACEIGRLDLHSGRIIDAGFKPTCESEMHLAIYRACPEVSAIVHVHPVTASAFAASGCKISNTLLAESYSVLGAVGQVEYCTFGTPELAYRVAEQAKKYHTMIMKNHGALTTGQSLLEAFDRLEVLENAAKTTLICEYLLRSPQPIAPELLRKLDK